VNGRSISHYVPAVLHLCIVHVSQQLLGINPITKQSQDYGPNLS
jgi:hypothetical protein